MHQVKVAALFFITGQTGLDAVAFVFAPLACENDSPRLNDGWFFRCGIDEVVLAEENIIRTARNESPHFSQLIRRILCLCDIARTMRTEHSLNDLK